MGQATRYIARFIAITGMICATSPFGTRASAEADKDKIKVAAIDFPPFSYHFKDQIKGIGVDLIRELLNRTKMGRIEIQINANRIEPMSKEDLALFPLVVRNEKREKQVQWIGKIATDRFCLATLANKPDIKGLGDAAALKSIGVNMGGSTEAEARKLGLANLEIAMNNSGNVRKLFASRIDAWFTTELVARHSAVEEGKTKAEIKCTGDFGPVDFWIAASNKMPAEMVSKLQAEFKKLESEGFLKQTLHSVASAR